MARLSIVLLFLSCSGKSEPAGGGGDCAELPTHGSLRVGPDAADNLTLTLEGCRLGTLSAAVVGSGDLSLDWRDIGEGWQPVLTAGVGGATVEGLSLRGVLPLGGVGEVVLWRQGYQSWSWSGVTALPDRVEMDGALPAVDGDGDGIDVVNEIEGTSWWVGLVGRAQGGSLLMGALSATKTRFYTAFAPSGDGVEAWAVWEDGPITLTEGESLHLDPIYLAFDDDPAAMLANYADAAAQITPPRPLSAAPPLGWTSWYQYYDAVTEADLRLNLDSALAKATAPGLSPLGLMQLDDGWETRWGDWTANEKFPSGMGALASEIAAAGLEPGLWMAPFYVATDTEVYAQHPDWWVRDAIGVPITYTNAGQQLVIIDTTVPGALDWMAQQVSDRVAEGWTYLKLDFLYAGAQQGQRSRPVTSIEAYHIGMKRLREAAGSATILACGAPLLPTLGYAEGMRTGADIAFVLDPDPRLGYLRWQGRATAGRAWMNGVWWWNDADPILMREPFTTVEATGAVVANAVSGGAWLLGDALPDLPADKLSLALSTDITALLGQTAVPEDPLAWVSVQDGGPPMEAALADDRVPPVWRFPDGTVALLNLSDGPIVVEGPGGTELFSGETAAAGERSLASGQGELWRP